MKYIYIYIYTHTHTHTHTHTQNSINTEIWTLHKYSTKRVFKKVDHSDSFFRSSLCARN